MRLICGLALVATAAGMSAGCGSTAHHPASLSLTDYLVRGNEETGLHIVGRPMYFHSVTTYETGDPNAPSDELRLTEAGFREAAAVNTGGVNGAQGISAVVELGSAAPAAREQEAELRVAALDQSVAVVHFVAPGIPGSTGVAAPGNQSTANLFFREGRCVLLVGDETSAADYRVSVIAAGRAIYARTHGRGGPCTS